MDASCRHVSGKDNAAILYRDYRMLCSIERVKRNRLYEQYRNQIELDITEPIHGHAGCSRTARNN